MMTQALPLFRMKKQRLSGKVALITGSGSGVGKAIAIALGQEGAFVFLNGRNEDKLKKTQTLLEEEGITSAYFASDVSHYEGSKMLIEACLHHFGRIDIVIPNAGESMQALFEDMDPKVFERVFNSNSLGAIFPVRAALSQIVANHGHIVFIHSLAGMHGVPSASAYSAGKMALTAFAQSLRIELADKGVHIGKVFLGFTENDVDKTVLNAEGKSVPVASRSKSLQLSQERVAREIVDVILKRKYQKVLSPLGKFMFFSVRLWPGLVRRILSRSFQVQREFFIKNHERRG